MIKNRKVLNKNLTGTLDVGVAQIDVTPQTPIRLSGFAARTKEETSKVLNRLYAKAIAFGSDSQEPSVFITVDLIVIQWRITKKLVERLSEKFGMSASQITICATHTHGSPEMGSLISAMQCRGDYPYKYSFSESLLELDQLIHIAQYNEELVKKLEEVTIAALKNRQPALVAWGKGHASFAENRRTTSRPVDHSLLILRVSDSDGTLRAVLANYACHGISLGPDVNEIHGDWMGEAQKMIEARYPGAIAMISIGCAGDIHPKLRDKMEYLEAYGKEIADNVDELLKTANLLPLTKAPVCSMKWIKLPFDKVPTVPELIELTNDPTIKGYYARLALDRIQRGTELPKELNYPIQTWNFGDSLMMINMGGEVVADYAVRLKEEFRADRIWINAYANDVSCYIASQRVIKEGGYEPDISMYWYDQPAPLSEEIETIIIDAIKEGMPASFKSKKTVKF